MHRRFVALMPAVLLPFVLLPFAACSSDDDAGDEVGLAPPPVPTDAMAPVDPVHDTPFCRAMLELDQGVPTLEDLVEAYAEVRPEVPADVLADFDVVLEHLTATLDGGAVDDPEQVEESTIELAAHIEMRCRGTAVSPLPNPVDPDPNPDPGADD